MFGKKKDEKAKGTEAGAPAQVPGTPQGAGDERRGKGMGPVRPLTQVEQAKRSLATIAGVSIAVAVAAVGFSGWRFVEASQMQSRLEGNMVQVVTVNRDVAAGQTIERQDVDVEGVPSQFVPEDAATATDQVVGKQSITNQGEGMAVSLSSVRASSQPATISAAISEGHVGYTLELDAASSLTPMLSVGDSVDVMGTTSDGVVKTSSVIVQDARVVALDGGFKSGGETRNYSLVTLELTPDQAQTVGSASGVKLLATPDGSTQGAGETDAE